MDQDPPIWFAFLAPLWVAAFIAASVMYRRRAGKPIFPRIPADARFVDRWASADFASNCLLVAVTDGELIVVPRFPFNLMFLPEIYGMEHRIPLKSISKVEIRKLFLSTSLFVTFGEQDRTLRLRVRDLVALEKALRRTG